MTSIRKQAKRRRKKATAYRSEAIRAKQERPIELERAVANVERILDPRADVAWNVELPTTKRIRQFDVMVRIGAAGRQFTTVFEVQDRSRAVDLPTFESWLPKLAHSGADRLTCVSKAGFTKAVMHDAATLNSRARLITFNDDGSPPWPVRMAFVELAKFLNTDQAARSIHAGAPCVVLQGSEERLTLEDLIWQRSIDGGFLMHVNPKPPATRLNVILDLARGPEKLHFIPEMSGVEIKHLTVLFCLVPFAAEDCIVRDAAYRQVGSDQPLLWATHARVRTCEEDAEVTLTTVKDGFGRYSIRQRISSRSEGKLLTRALPMLSRDRTRPEASSNTHL